MRSNKAFLYSIVFITLATGIFFVSTKETLNSQINYNPYRAGPPKDLVSIQITFVDPEDASKGILETATFNGKTVDLQPQNPTRIRATIYPQISPGEYELTWTVRKNYAAWPQTVTHSKEITITNRDQWMNILVEGDQLTIQ